MELETRQIKASTTLERWLRSYGKIALIPEETEKLHGLEKLGGNPSPEAINQLMGSDTWTNCQCSECDGNVDAVVRVGEEPDYESNVAWLCKPCVEKALAMFPAPKGKR